MFPGGMHDFCPFSIHAPPSVFLVPHCPITSMVRVRLASLSLFRHPGVSPLIRPPSLRIPSRIPSCTVGHALDPGPGPLLKRGRGESLPTEIAERPEREPGATGSHLATAQQSTPEGGLVRPSTEPTVQGQDSTSPRGRSPRSRRCLAPPGR